MKNNYINNHKGISALFSYSLIILFLFIHGTSYSQCFNFTAFASATAPTLPATTVTISTCNYQTEYATIFSVQAGQTYSVNNSNGGCATVTQGTPTGTVIAVGNVPLNWTATISGTYYIHWTDDCLCTTSTGCDVTTIECLSCAAPTCTDGIQIGDETGIDCGGTICPPCPSCFDGIQVPAYAALREARALSVRTLKHP